MLPIQKLFSTNEWIFKINFEGVGYKENPTFMGFNEVYYLEQIGSLLKMLEKEDAIM